MIEFNLTGYSDDLVEIDGDISEELNFYPTDDSAYVACYDGTLLQVTFDEDSNWRFRCLAVGYAFKRVEPLVPGGNAYTDTVYFEDTQGTQSVKWFALGEQMQVAR